MAQVITKLAYFKELQRHLLYGPMTTHDHVPRYRCQSNNIPSPLPQATPELLSKATNMKVIGRAGVGIDNIDVAEATRKGVLVMNTPGGNTVSTAQLAISLLCSAARYLRFILRSALPR